MKTRYGFVVKALAVTLVLALAFGLGPVGMRTAKAAPEQVTRTWAWERAGNAASGGYIYYDCGAGYAASAYSSTNNGRSGTGWVLDGTGSGEFIPSYSVSIQYDSSLTANVVTLTPLNGGEIPYYNNGGAPTNMVGFAVTPPKERLALRAISRNTDDTLAAVNSAGAALTLPWNGGKNDILADYNVGHVIGDNTEVVVSENGCIWLYVAPESYLYARYDLTWAKTDGTQIEETIIFDFGTNKDSFTLKTVNEDEVPGGGSPGTVINPVATDPASIEVYLGNTNVSGSTISRQTSSTVALSAIVESTGIKLSVADSEITWDSSNPAVATVDANGVVTCLSAGTAIITATSTGAGGATAFVTINVSEPWTAPTTTETYTTPAPAVWGYGYYGTSTYVSILQSNLKLTTAVPGSNPGTVVLTCPGTLPSGATIQWQMLVDGVWTDIAGATTTPFTVNGLTPGGVNTFRAVVKYNGTTYTSSEMIAAAGQEAVVVTPPAEDTAPATTVYVVKVRALNIRADAATKSSKLATLSRNDTINVISVENGWAKFMFNGKEAYASLGSGKYLAVK